MRCLAFSGRSVPVTAARRVPPPPPPPPPYSNERTSVWYWTLDGVQTTVMLNKTTMEVWCNGRTLPTTVRPSLFMLSVYCINQQPSVNKWGGFFVGSIAFGCSSGAVMPLLRIELSLLLHTPQQILPMLFDGLDNPQKCPGPTRVSQMASRSVQQFLHSSPVCQSHRHTDRQTHTHHATAFCSNRPHLYNTKHAMRLNNEQV